MRKYRLKMFIEYSNSLLEISLLDFEINVEYC